ncbi:hypothetical protein BS17DRAFT_769276 [Gyrodon lividus]|nr:hypothetical protein BS17DRAFT_769276 [Gyrodon lividus]
MFLLPGITCLTGLWQAMYRICPRGGKMARVKNDTASWCMCSKPTIKGGDSVGAMVALLVVARENSKSYNPLTWTQKIKASFRQNPNTPSDSFECVITHCGDSQAKEGKVNLTTTTQFQNPQKPNEICREQLLKTNRNALNLSDYCYSTTTNVFNISLRPPKPAAPQRTGSQAPHAIYSNNAPLEGLDRDSNMGMDHLLPPSPTFNSPMHNPMAGIDSTVAMNALGLFETNEPDIKFVCPRCHELKDRQAIEESKRAYTPCWGVDVNGSPPTLLRGLLAPFLPGNNLLYEEIEFNLGTQEKDCTHAEVVAPWSITCMFLLAAFLSSSPPTAKRKEVDSKTSGILTRALKHFVKPERAALPGIHMNVQIYTSLGSASTVRMGCERFQRASCEATSLKVSFVTPSKMRTKGWMLFELPEDKILTLVFKPEAWESANALFGSTQGAAISLGLESTVEEVYSTWSPQAMEGS